MTSLKLNHKKSYLILAILFSLIVCPVLLIKINRTPRYKYEKFLLNESKSYAQRSKLTIDIGGRFDHPEMAALRDFKMTLDPSLKRVPTERLRTAFKLTKKFKTEYKKSDISTEGLVWEELKADMGGRTRAIMFDPNDAENKKVWAGAVTGGLWYNNDITSDSTHWIPVNDFWDNLVISSIIYDPNNPQVFYLGTGEPQTALVTYRESSGRGIGIWKTEDAGITWNIIPSTENFAYITDIIIRIEDGKSVIYTGVVSGQYKGANYESVPTDGLYRSVDGGETWQQVLPNIEHSDKPYAPADIDLGADNRIYVGTQKNLDGDGGATIIYSDDAQNWTIYDDYKTIIEKDRVHGYPDYNLYYNVPGRVIIATAPSDQNRVYALFGSAVPDVYPLSRCYYLIRSDNKGESWTGISMPYHLDDSTSNINWAYISWHALIGKVDPNNANTLYVGGINTHKSVDSGLSWKCLSSGDGIWPDENDDTAYVHVDQHNIAFRPGSSDEIVFTNDGGVFYTSNATDEIPHFSERANSYNTLQGYTCAIHPEAGKRQYLMGTQDNSTMNYNKQVVTHNDIIMGGDGAFCFIDRDEPNIQIGAIQWNLYGFTNDYWKTQTDFYDFFQVTGTFINPADYDHGHNILYANATTDWGDYPSAIVLIHNVGSSPEGRIVELNTSNSVPFSCVKVSPYSPDYKTTLYLGTESGRLFKVHDANSNPSVKEIGSKDFPSAYISCIEIGKSEAELLVIFSNYGVKSVWYSDDGGINWYDKEGNLPDMPIRWAIIHPQNTKNCLIATEIGVWSTIDITEDNVAWEPAYNSLANVRVDMLRFRESDNTVIAATHGRGLFKATYTVEPEYFPGIKPIDDIIIFPNPNNGLFNLVYNYDQKTHITIALYDISGILVHKEQFISYPGEYYKTIQVYDFSPGMHVLIVDTEGSSKSKKVLLLK
jgi:photosystem II stability/assembly factor-like uncharacterized protein